VNQQPNQNPSSKGPVIGLLAIVIATPFVAAFEGLSLTTYQDPIGVPTVCLGETDRVLTMRDRITKEECYAILGASLQKNATELSKCITAPLKPNEAAAILSWGYNVGSDAACKSTLVTKLNNGFAPGDWCPELRRWVYAGGQKLKGLERRREKEFEMCVGVRNEVIH